MMFEPIDRYLDLPINVERTHVQDDIRRNVVV